MKATGQRLPFFQVYKCKNISPIARFLNSLAIFGEIQIPQFPFVAPFSFNLCFSKINQNNRYGMFQYQGAQKKTHNKPFSRVPTFPRHTYSLPNAFVIPSHPKVEGKRLAWSRSAKEAVPGNGKKTALGPRLKPSPLNSPPG